MPISLAGSGNVVLSGGAWQATNTAVTVTGAANSLLLVWMFAVGGTSAVTWDAAGHRPTWNGTELTKLLSGSSVIFGNYLSVELYYMVAPSVGSFTLTTYMAANVYNTWAVWGQVGGAAQSAPTAFTSVINQANNNAATSGTLTPATAAGMMFSAVLQQGSTAVAVNQPTGHTLVQNTGAGNVPGGVGRYTYSSLSSVTMTWSHTGTNTEWTNLLVAVEEFSAISAAAWQPDYPDLLATACRPARGLPAAYAQNFSLGQPVPQVVPTYAATTVDALVPKHPTTHVSEQWYTPIRSMRPERKLVFSGAVYPDTAPRRLTPIRSQLFVTATPARVDRNVVFFAATYSDAVRRVRTQPREYQYTPPFTPPPVPPPFSGAVYDAYTIRRARSPYVSGSASEYPWRAQVAAPLGVAAYYDAATPRHPGAHPSEQFTYAAPVYPEGSYPLLPPTYPADIRRPRSSLGVSVSGVLLPAAPFTWSSLSTSDSAPRASERCPALAGPALTQPLVVEPAPIQEVFFFQPSYPNMLERVRLLHEEATFSTFSQELTPLPNEPPTVVVLRLAIEALRPVKVAPFVLATSRVTVRTDFPLRVKTRIV